ncbi:hypothetical protein KQX54_003318 [Cotesia glomerata]|uniref:Uncharacterized protein n=1 Tax=Cotesia glomerata TaxID=32391 RepID=A0AAV7HWY2_COTGL|nr:hypothetical protein KQX54_003318 [Cotesia glomerata]
MEKNDDDYKKRQCVKLEGEENTSHRHKPRRCLILPSGIHKWLIKLDKLTSLFGSFIRRSRLWFIHSLTSKILLGTHSRRHFFSGRSHLFSHWAFFPDDKLCLGGEMPANQPSFTFSFYAITFYVYSLNSTKILIILLR